MGKFWVGTNSRIEKYYADPNRTFATNEEALDWVIANADKCEACSAALTFLAQEKIRS